MSAGLSFGSLPAFADLSPDQQAMVMQSLQARASEQQQPGSPDQLLFNRAGMGGGQNGFQPPQDGGPTQTGAVGREAHQSAPMIAMDEAAVRRMEQPMLPPTAGGNVPPVPQAAPPQQGGPVAPAMPAPTAAPSQPAPQAAPQMSVVNSFDPLTGQAVSGSPRPMQAPNGQAPGVSPTAAAQASGQAGGGGSFLEKFANGLNNPQVGNLLLNVGIGLMSQRGFGPGIAAGLQQAQASGMGDVKQQLEQYKFMQEQQGKQAQLNYLTKTKGYSPEAAAAMVANPTLLSNQFSRESAAPHTIDIGGTRYVVPPGAGTDQSKYVPLGPAGESLEQKVKTADALANVADQHGESIEPLVDPEKRAAAGIPQGDNRPAWVSSKGKVTFDNQNAPKIIAVRGPDGTTLQKIDPLTNTATPVNGGGGAAQDNKDVPPGVDPQTFRREMAKSVVKEKASATDRGLMADQAAPILDRAEKAYRTIAQGEGIGPFQASSANRFLEGARGHPNEVARQDYEAAAKELELMKAQISMKGQGAITEGERKILQTTLPRLDAADQKTGLDTFTSLRGQFSRAQSAERLPVEAPKPPPGAPEGARQAPDGNWYVPDPDRGPGKYKMVRP